jgi:hypothetical protein
MMDNKYVTLVLGFIAIGFGLWMASKGWKQVA